MDKKMNLPVIIGMGGINCAGRTSNFHSYKRIICDALDQKELKNTWRDLSHKMGLNDPLSPETMSKWTRTQCIRFNRAN